VTMSTLLSHRSRGVALLVLVLVAFVLLSVLAAVIFSVSMQTYKIESWQADHNNRMRLSYLARSSANAVIEGISDDVASLGASELHPIDKKASVKLIDADAVSLDIEITGDASPYVIVKTEASDGKAEPVTVTAQFNVNTKKIVNWGGSL